MFETLGEKSRREILIELVADAAPGFVFTYDTLGEAINGSREEVQGAVHVALKDLERNHKKTLEVVRNVGYRVVNPAEHIRLATKHQTKATRSLKRAKSKVAHVDYADLTPEERAEAIRAETALSAQLGFGRRSNLAQKNKERIDRFLMQNGQIMPKSSTDLAKLRDQTGDLSRRLEQGK